MLPVMPHGSDEEEGDGGGDDDDDGSRLTSGESHVRIGCAAAA